MSSVLKANWSKMSTAPSQNQKVWPTSLTLASAGRKRIDRMILRSIMWRLSIFNSISEIKASSFSSWFGVTNNTELHSLTKLACIVKSSEATTRRTWYKQPWYCLCDLGALTNSLNIFKCKVYSVFKLFPWTFVGILLLNSSNFQNWHYSTWMLHSMRDPGSTWDPLRQTPPENRK